MRRKGAVVYSRCVHVHCPRRLSAAAAVLTAEVSRGDGMFALWTVERGQAMHHLDRVMSHTFKCNRLSGQGPEPKLPRLESA
jgi:hypothetical protein